MSILGRTASVAMLTLVLAACSVAGATTPTPTPNASVNQCDPAAHDCPVGTDCYCCCGTWMCMPPFLPCCALPCSPPVPTVAPTPTAVCHPIAALTDCKVDGDCVVVDQIDCCPCSAAGHQAAINRSKQDELSQQLEVCCAAAGVCPSVDQCEDNLAAVCQRGACVLVNTSGVATPTPAGTTTPTPPEIGIGEFCEPDRICPPPLLCLIDPPHQARVCSCVGDCNGSAKVTVDELVTLVNIALGNTAASICTLGDGNGDGTITVDEIVLALNNLLDDCGATQATPRPTPVLPRGHTCCECADAACTDFAWVEVERSCPPGCQTFEDAECEAPCHGGPQGGPATCVSLTPCAVDADCDDGNGCSVDRCSLDGCTHACVCD